MRISGTEPSSVILSQTCSIKSWKVMTKKFQNKRKPKGMVLWISYTTSWIIININFKNESASNLKYLYFIDQYY